MPQTPSKITIREVAALAGVSVMTVSRVMRNEPHVAQSTQQRVRQAIDKLNYEPLQSARNLSSSVAKVIGLVMPNINSVMPQIAGYEYVAALHLGALQVCNELDYSLMMFHTGDAQSVARLVRRAQSRQVGGYVIASPSTDVEGLMSTLQAHGVAYSAINPLTEKAAAQWAICDDRAASRELALHLGAHGHRHIALVGFEEHHRAHRERLAGHLEALAMLKIKPRKSWMVSTGATFEEGLIAGRKLLARTPAPTAIQCMTDDQAAGVMAAAFERGLRLPQDLSVVGFDNFGLARKLSPGLTTAELPVEALVAHATRQVIATLEGSKVENATLPCSLKLRHSVAPPAH